MSDNIRTTSNVDVSKITTLDDFYSKTQGIGSIEKAIGNNIYGVNHINVKSFVPLNKDSYGLVFFTRPQLNLSTPNLRNIRKLYNLLTTTAASQHRAVRCLLDPRLHYNQIKCPLVDSEFGFIPVLTNQINSMSGWPDEVLPTFTSKEGVRREQWAIGDGSLDIYEAYDLDCTFSNMKDEIIMSMFHTWIYYIANVFENKLSPYMDFITENEIDYNTRIYRLVLDETNTHVKHISATGAAFPLNVPTGRLFDYNKSANYNDQNKEINIRFKAIGALYFDDILVKEFNEVNAIFNSEYRKLIKGSSNSLVKIQPEDRVGLNYRGYPYINPNTMELEWYISSSSLTYKNYLALKGK